MKLVVIVFIAANFFTSCNKNNKSYSPILHQNFSIRLPVSWDSIRNWPTDQDVIANKFIGERDMLTGLEFHVYNINNDNSILIDTLIARQLKTQLIKNVTTEIINTGKKTINNKTVGYIEYFFKKNDSKRFGETILAINKEEVYILDIYSLNQNPKDFRVKCHTIIESIVFSAKND